MGTQWWIGFVSSFLASGVEVVEAVTIVLATGVTRGWRSTWIGVGTAAIALTAIVAILGPALQTYIPLDALRIVIGTLLLIFGLQWIRKAIMRYTGLKDLHDEEKIYQREVAGLNAAPRAATQQGIDWTAFTVAFKGVLLEGLEVVFIVITFGVNYQDITPVLLGAVVAAILVIAAAMLIHQPLSRVPENSLKFVVGIMLTGFGTFWAGEGIGLHWPGEDWAILALIAFYGVTAAVLVAWVKQRRLSGAGSGEVVGSA